MHNQIEEETIEGGVKSVTRLEIQNKSMINYLDFVSSRYSIRNFTGEDVDENLVYDALRIAQSTPSACNRQPWYNYVFFNKSKIIEILDFQTGARQFKDDIACVIMVTADYNSFFGGEIHQPYVNGGMYDYNNYRPHESLGNIPPKTYAKSNN